MIQTKNLTKRYGSFPAVEKVNLSIPPGEIYGFLGPNGAGKTTTIRMLLGTLRPSSGEIYLFGEKYRPHRLDLRRNIGVVPEKHPGGMWKWMTAFEYLEFFAGFFEVPRARKRIESLLEQVNLLTYRNRKIAGFSRGMLQKMSIVRALLHNPDLLFLDEPISGLDPLGIKQIRDLILAENRDGRTVFVSSHLLSEMEKICHRVAIIFNGHLIAEDDMSSLLANLSGGREIEIEFEDLPPALAGELETKEYVLATRVEGKRLIVKVPGEGDFRKTVSGFLFNKGLIPLGIRERSLSLEEAFTTITRENVTRLAGTQGGKE